MAKIIVKAGQIWRDDCYCLDRETGECKRKYVLILAVDPGGSDAVTAALTSKSNGLTKIPACSLGPPRAGYFVGVPGGELKLPTWVDFSSVDILDSYDLGIHVGSGRTSLITQTLDREILCAVLRCALQSDDITGRQARWIGNTAAALSCP